MTQRVFEPLKMERTLVAEADAALGTTSAASQKSASGPNYTCLAGAGAFLSTPTDLVRLGSAMLKPGLLKAETIDVFRTPVRLGSGETSTYALGWTVGSVPFNGGSTRVVSHRGSPSGGTVSLLTFPDLGIAIAAAAHVTNAKGVNPFARQVAEVFAKHPNP